MAGPATLLDKVWASHAILVRHLVHDGSGNAFRMLKEKSRRSGAPGVDRLADHAGAQLRRRLQRHQARQSAQHLAA